MQCLLFDKRFIFALIVLLNVNYNFNTFCLTLKCFFFNVAIENL